MLVSGHTQAPPSLALLVLFSQHPLTNPFTCRAPSTHLALLPSGLTELALVVCGSLGWIPLTPPAPRDPLHPRMTLHQVLFGGMGAGAARGGP